MKTLGKIGWIALGMVLGLALAVIYSGTIRTAHAYNDRYEDFVLCTGQAQTMFNVPTEGVWLLDYRSGKLLGTLIDRTRGKILDWSEVDLVQEFEIPPRQNVHFMMTTGAITQGQAALYVAETTTGRFGVYTMGQRPDHEPGLVIRRHDLGMFRKAPALAGP
jgi:hypothetical protein